MPRIVPFKTPVDYFVQLLGGDKANLNRFHEIWSANPGWQGYDNDLHIYPYVDAKPAMLSAGCKNRCPFCPTAAFYNGNVYRGDFDKILPPYKGCQVHFMDEDFFENNYDNMDDILKALRSLNITWLAMTHNSTLNKIIDRYGEDYLYDCGCVCIEVGLENVALMMKIRHEVKLRRIALYYLNMVLLPGETKETIRANGKFMETRTLEKPIHFNNGTAYGPGQYYHIYDDNFFPADGLIMPGLFARAKPSYVPDSLLEQNFKIRSLEHANYFSQLVYGFKAYNPPKEGSIAEFVELDSERLMWLIVGLRIGAIV